MKLIIATLIGIGLGFIISYQNLEKIKTNETYLFNVTYKSIDGEVIDLYGKNSTSKIFTFAIRSINNIAPPGKIKILIKTRVTENIAPGSIIRFNHPIKRIINSNGFEYDKYLLQKDIYGESAVYNYSLIGLNDGFYYKYILKTRCYFIDIISKIYPGDSARLVSGILLGIKSDYPKELKDNFSRSGLSHIVAVSGYNITILIIFFSFLLKAFPKIIRVPFIILLIIAFLFLVGDNSPAIRAGIMGIIAFIFLNNGKKINIYSLTLITSLFLISLNPLIINYDIGFQLSFLAMLGLITLGDILNKKISFLPSKFSIKENIVATVSVLITGMPVVLTNFGQISIISPISNLFVLPLVPYSMLLSTISVFLYPFSEKIGIYVGFLSYVLLKTILNLANFFGGLKYSIIKFDIGDDIYIFNAIYILILGIIIGILLYRDIKSKDQFLPD